MYSFTQTGLLNTDAVVSLEEAKQHLGVDIDDDDAEIESFISAAVTKVSKDISRPLVPTEYTLKLDSLGSDIVIPIRPLQSVVSFSYIDVNDATQTLTEDVDFKVYSKDASDVYGQLVTLGSWPDLSTTFDRELATIVVTVGFKVCPFDLKSATLLLIKNFYDVRGDDARFISRVPITYSQIIQNYQVINFGHSDEI